jgi:hypothetical protein
MLKKIALLMVATASAFAMHGVDININSKDLEVGAKLDMGQFNYNVEPNTVFVGVRFLKGDASHSDYHEDYIKDFYEMNFLMKRAVENTGLTLGLGLKLNHTENDTNKFTSVPLGIEANYKLPIDSAIPFYLGGSLYYAPEVLTMNEANNFLEYRVHFEAELIKNGFVTLGYRNIDTNYEVGGRNYDVKYNKSAYLGFKFLF